MRALRGRCGSFWVTLILIVAVLNFQKPSVAAVTREEVERAIREGVRFLIKEQRDDGSWADVENDARTGVTSMVTLALLTAGEKPESKAVRDALDFLRGFTPSDLRSTYAISLQTMVYAAADPAKDLVRIAANVEWLQEAQIKPGDPQYWPGSWSYSESKRGRPGDNSNTQYALLGLHAASEVGVPVKQTVWELSRNYWERSQKRDGSWAYTPDSNLPSASMSCAAGISSLIISGLRRFQGGEFLEGETIQDCGAGGVNRNLQRGIDWLASHFQVGQNFGAGTQWKFYYLYGLERAGRLAGIRFFGQHDWYRLGAEELVHEQDRLDGHWEGALVEKDRVLATSFALLFLAKGRAPVLINKLRHGPSGDWDNDADDIRNIVNVVSHTWKNLLTWQVVDPAIASVPELLQAPIIYLNGHKAPEFNALARQNLKEFVEQGGFIFADACCSSREFDAGFKQLMKEVFPQDDYKLRPLAQDHPVWRAKNVLSPEVYPLWGIEHGCRTVVIYSPADLSCYWNQTERSPNNPAVIGAVKVAENVIDYATGREMPADKLTLRELQNRKTEPPKRGSLRIGKLMHAGDWNIARQAIPNLMDVLSRPPFNMNVVIDQKDLFARDPSMVYYPLIYIHGRALAVVPQGRSRCAKEPSRPRRRHALRRRGLRQPGLRRLVPAVCDRAPSHQPPGSYPEGRRALHAQDRRRPFQGAIHQGGRRRPRFSSARGGAIERPLGDHLFEVRHRLCARAAYRHRVQRLHLRKRAQDRRQHRHLRDAPLTVRTGFDLRFAVRAVE